MISDLLCPPSFLPRKRKEPTKPFDRSKVMGHLGELGELRKLVKRTVPFDPKILGDTTLGKKKDDAYVLDGVVACAG